MRYFFQILDGGHVNILASDRVPGDGGADGKTLPIGFVEVPAEMFRSAQETPGCTFVDGEIVAPAPRAAAVDLRTFFQLFTRAEVLAISAQRQSDPDIEYWWTFLMLGQTVDLGSPSVDEGLDMLIGKELITGERKTAILANERPPVKT